MYICIAIDKFIDANNHDIIFKSFAVIVVNCRRLYSEVCYKSIYELFYFIL